ncbi:Rad9 family protein [Babesia bovis T2Bo]|uniref:Uncharacterized protein n=1 Tax=Babesia bovis TaxID=5865 RepID=A7APB8_BABBO|nr:Rad9 family protein [Babesia bovis T2Bo]EDO08402.1 Rad9 family protein [Babesia bovis T2Bo]|eukprot:XP_001611970.1 hypothetical protein [Babesia bovis T2Bo]
MEYELNATQTLLLKRIFLLFRQVSTNVQIIASENGLNLYALNGSNSAWLHIQLGKDFFRKIDIGVDEATCDPQDVIKHWLFSTKNLCQALNIVSAIGARNQGYSAVFLKDGSNTEENTVRATVALEKLLIREEQDHGNLVSFVMCCAEEHIQRSSILCYEDHRVSIPDDICWQNWHYMRMQPSLLNKSISPYWSPFDDISISYDSVKDLVTLSVVKSSFRVGRKTKSKAGRRAGISGKITINGSHFIKLKIDDGIQTPNDVVISLKELISLSSFSDSIKSPLSLVIRNPGDPVILLFGDAVDIADNTDGEISIHQVVAQATTQMVGAPYDNILLTNPNKAWAGSLWLSSMQQPGDPSTNTLTVDTGGEATVDPEESVLNTNSEDTPVPEEEPELLKEATPKASKKKSKKKSKKSESSPKSPKELGNTPAEYRHLTYSQRDDIYKTILLDFMPSSCYLPGVPINVVGGTPMDSSQYTKSDSDSLYQTDSRNSDILCSQLAGIW